MADIAVTARPLGGAVPVKAASAQSQHSEAPATTRPATAGAHAPTQDFIPQAGLGRWRTFGKFVGVSREKWRQLVLEGKAPQPIRMGTRCALYELAEIHAWIADPLNYRAGA